MINIRFLVLHTFTGVPQSIAVRQLAWRGYRRAPCCTSACGDARVISKLHGAGGALAGFHIRKFSVQTKRPSASPTAFVGQ
jgi:hypothetical protein